MDEIYLHLGKNEDVHFFMHTIANPAFESAISAQVHNAMIHESRITDAQTSVIIYEIDPFANEINLTITQHAEKEDGPDEYDSRSVASLLVPLARAPRDGMYAIKHNYGSGIMETYEIPNIDMPSTNKLPESGPKISSVTYFVTKKPLH